MLPAVSGVSRKLFSAMPFRSPGVIGIEDLPLLVEAFVSSFLPGITANIHKSATFSTTLNASGQLTSIEVSEPGFGYASAPTISFSGEAIAGLSTVNPSVTVGITSSGQVDIDNITINSAGSGFANIFAGATANPNAGKISSINIVGLSDKNFKQAPSLIFDAPTAKDVDGNLLSSNVTATGTLTIATADDLSDPDNPIYKGEITGSTITQAGSGYVVDPGVKINSKAVSYTHLRAHET